MGSVQNPLKELGDIEMKRKYILSGVIFLLILIGGVTFYLNSSSEDGYLRKNSFKLNLDKVEDYSDIKALDKALKDKEILFIGETHRLKENVEIQQKFLNFLIDNWNLKYYVLETGYAQTMLMNEYLKTGDEELLNEVFQELGWISSAFSQDQLEMMKAIYEKNKNLSEEKKITIIGIDAPQVSEELTLKYIEMLIKKVDNFPNELLVFQKNMEELCSKQFNTTALGLPKEKRDNIIKEIMPLISEIKEHIAQNRNLYESTFKEDLFHIEYIVSAIENMQKIPQLVGVSSIESNEDSLNVRDVYIYENFEKVYEHYPKGKYYFQMGSGHVDQKPIRIKTIASHIQNNDKFKGKIYSIKTFYGDTYIARPSGEKTPVHSNISSELDATLVNLFGNEYENIFINLDGNRSPLRNKLDRRYFSVIENEVLKEDEQNVTTDYFQGVIVIKKPTSSNIYDLEK